MKQINKKILHYSWVIGALFFFVHVRAGQADALYEKGDYVAALSLYRQITPATRSLYYAMGACCYNLGDDALALAYWKKAEGGAPPSLHEALDAGRKRIYAKVGRDYHVGWFEKIKRRIMAIPLLWIQLWIMIVIAFQFLGRRYARRFFKTNVVLISLAIVGMVHIYYRDEDQCGIIRNRVAVRVGPGHDYAEAQELSFLDEVTVEDKKDTWYKIRRSETKGWVEDKDLSLV